VIVSRSRRRRRAAQSLRNLTHREAMAPAKVFFDMTIGTRALQSFGSMSRCDVGTHDQRTLVCHPCLTACLRRRAGWPRRNGAFH